ncbi:hypothetical protein A3765_15050 [Oleiphilus sp. HI0130]|nr:hypothetical protein A3765_15050 [Oleiphilus sp. HI0130]
MKKVFLLRATGQVLGAEKVVLELAEELPKHGYHPIIGIPVEHGVKPDLYHAAIKQGSEVFTFDIRSAFDLRAIKKIKAFIRKNEIDIIHSHGYREDFYTLFGSGPAKKIATNHLWKKSNRKLRLYALLDSIMLRRFDKVVAVSQPILEEMKQKNIPSDKLYCISNGIKLKESEELKNIREELDLKENAYLIGTLSSLTTEKGIDTAIKALALITDQLPQARLIVTGDGRERDNLEELARNLSITDKVLFLGRREDTHRILKSLDMFVMPSLKEGLPIALLEAMAARLPIIATKVGDIPKVINKLNGVVIEASIPHLLAEEVQYLYKNPTTAKTLGEKAYETVKNEFSASSMTRKYADLYDHVLT